MNVMGFYFYNAEFCVLLYKKGRVSRRAPEQKDLFENDETKKSLTNKEKPNTINQYFY